MASMRSTVIGRIEQRALARARTAAAKVRRGDRGLIEQHDRRARAELWVVGMADADAGNIGDEISSQSGLQGLSPNHIRSSADHITARGAPLRLRPRAAPCI